MWQINLLDQAFTSIRAEMAEMLAKFIATEKLNMLVVRPHEIIQFLSQNNRHAPLLNSPEFLFLKKYQKTMDFFAIWPKTNPNLVGARPTDLIEYYFTNSGLLKYTNPPTLRGYALEVKSFQLKHDSQFFDNTLTLSEKQKKMIKDIEKNPQMDLLLARVGFWGKYNVSIKFLSIKKNVLSPDLFNMPSNEG